MFYAVRKGWFRGVFVCRSTAMRAVRFHPDPKIQEFFSRRMADNYVYRNKGLIAYTDGSFQSEKCIAGFGVWVNNGIEQFGMVPIRKPTSQLAEAYAAFIALLLTDGDIEIRTDSLQLVYFITSRFYRGSLHRAISDLCDGRIVTWTYIKAHNGYAGNEHADWLAKRGCNTTPMMSLANGRTYLEVLMGLNRNTQPLFVF